MKTIRLLVSLCAVSMLAACQVPDISKLDAKIPNGNWEQAKVEVSGKFTSTTLNATGAKVDGKWVRGELHFTHSNPWVLKATLDLKVKPNEEGDK